MWWVYQGCFDFYKSVIDKQNLIPKYQKIILLNVLLHVKEFRRLFNFTIFKIWDRHRMCTHKLSSKSISYRFYIAIYSDPICFILFSRLLFLDTFILSICLYLISVLIVLFGFLGELPEFRFYFLFLCSSVLLN